MPKTESKTPVVNNMEIILGEIGGAADAKAEYIRSTGLADAAHAGEELGARLEADLRQEYVGRRAKEEKLQKIERSKRLNASKMRILEEKDRILADIVARVQRRVIAQLEDDQYKARLYEGLIRESISTLRERLIYVKCRECDLAVVEAVLKGLNTQFARKIQLKVHPERLTPLLVSDDVISGCIGGIVLMSRDGKISVDDTMNKRIAQATHALTPYINETVFFEEKKDAEQEQQQEQQAE